MTIKQVWEQGPSREFSTERFPGCMPYGTQGYVGQYHCQKCSAAVSGVYLTAKGWLCAGCKHSITPRLAEPRGLKRARLAKKARVGA